MNNIKTIVQFISTGGFYGAERVMVELASYFANIGMRSKIVVVQSPGAQTLVKKAERENIDVSILRNSGLGSFGLFLQMKKFIREQEIDIIHSHSYKTDILIRLANISSKIKTIATCHTWYSYTIKMKLYEKLDKWSLKSFAHVVLVSPQLVKDVRNNGLSPQKTSLIRNGVYLSPCIKESARKKIRSEFGFKDSDKLIIRVGRLVQSKGNLNLLEAFSQVIRNFEAQLLFVGEGEELDLLLKKAGHLGVQNNITFTGFRDDISELLCAADIFVISSHKEGLPIVLIEAMAAKKAIITTEVGAIGSVIKNGENGWLVQPGQIEPLAEALIQALSNPKESQRRAENAYQCYIDGYSREAMGSSYLNLYESL
ncbi:glycosyltransferase family 4 protein [Thermodesulfobacteriota bacterium]